MSTNRTPNYNLHSWVPEDDFLRSEFNDNFTSLDSALKTLSDGLAAEISARTSAVAAEQTDRANAVNAEAQTRASAVSSLTASISSLSTGKTEVVVGTYTGNDAVSQAIALGFQPKALIVTDDGNRMRVNDFVYGGIALPGQPVRSGVGESLIEITATGFTVYRGENQSTYAVTNSKNYSFRYIAFK